MFHLLEEIGDQLGSRAELILSPLACPAQPVLMVPTILRGSSIEGMGIVIAEQSLSTLILQDDRIVDPMRLLLGHIDPIGANDDLPTTFHPAKLIKLERST